MLEGEFCLAEFILNRARSWIWQKHFSRESDVELKTDIAERLKYAPLAQLVEHLTLNQGVPGSSP